MKFPSHIPPLEVYCTGYESGLGGEVTYPKPLAVLAEMTKPPEVQHFNGKPEPPVVGLDELENNVLRVGRFRLTP